MKTENKYLLHLILIKYMAFNIIIATLSYNTTSIFVFYLILLVKSLVWYILEIILLKYHKRICSKKEKPKKNILVHVKYPNTYKNKNEYSITSISLKSYNHDSDIKDEHDLYKKCCCKNGRGNETYTEQDINDSKNSSINFGNLCESLSKLDSEKNMNNENIIKLEHCKSSDSVFKPLPKKTNKSPDSNNDFMPNNLKLVKKIGF